MIRTFREKLSCRSVKAYAAIPKGFWEVVVHCCLFEESSLSGKKKKMKIRASISLFCFYYFWLTLLLLWVFNRTKHCWGFLLFYFFFVHIKMLSVALSRNVFLVCMLTSWHLLWLADKIMMTSLKRAELFPCQSVDFWYSRTYLFAISHSSHNVLRTLRIDVSDLVQKFFSAMFF